MSKQSLTLPRPRNPFATLAQRRCAGTHRASERSARQAAQRQLREALSPCVRWRSP